ncbi:MAG: DUF3048 C-terminal domain-containing protein [Jatrophihabitans sp.]
MTSSPRTTCALVASFAVVALLGVAACGGSGTKKPTSASPTATTSTANGAAAPVNPLRGGAPSSNGVVGVKIDDTGNGRPQRNIDKADVVYIEEVEGGLTRLLAVFQTNLPVVEAVRSTRAADPEILAQYGPIAYAASGGAHNPLSVLDKSPLKTSINDRGGPGFKRDGSRSAPYNLTANLATIAKARKAPRARNVGFTWATASAQLAGATTGTRIQTRVGGTPVEFRYDAATHRYNRYIGGALQRTAAGRVISTPNVIVQFCKVVPYPADRDVNGNPNAFTYTVGSGKVVVFRDGKRIAGTWSRAAQANPTRYADVKGAPILLRPGGTWVVLTRTGTPLG